MLTLPHDPKAGALKCTHGLEVVNAGNLRHASDRNFDFSHLKTLCRLVDGIEVFDDRVSNVLQRLFFGRALRPATGKAGTGDGVPFFGMQQNDAISHVHINQPTPQSNP